MILSKLVHFPFFLLSACQAPVRKGNLLLTNSCSETTNVRLLSLSLFMEEKLRSYASSDTFNFPPAPRSSLSSRSFLRWLTSLAFTCNFHFTTFDHLATFLPSPFLPSRPYDVLRRTIPSTLRFRLPILLLPNDTVLPSDRCCYR